MRKWYVRRDFWAVQAVGLALLALGLLVGRFDLALFGMPLLLAIVLGKATRPTAPTSAEFQASPNHQYLLDVAADQNAEAMQVRVFTPGHRPTSLLTTPGSITFLLNSKRTGPYPTFTAQVASYGPFGFEIEKPTLVTAPESFGLPTVFSLRELPLPTRLRGLSGARNSRRIGEGGELRDIATMRPGDSLRRVDWRATGRRSPNLDQLYVRRTFSHAEGVAELVIDSRDDVGPDLETWRGTGQLRVDDLTSLDLARHAAASVAGALLAAGDRVGMEDLAFQRRPISPATGGRQLRRIQQALGLSAPRGEPAEVIRPPRLPADAVIYLFTTLLDDSPVELTRGWIEQGNPVIVIDTLPKVRLVRSESLNMAWRITSMERDFRLAALQAQAIPVIPWQQADSVLPAAELAKLARAQSRMRVRR